MVFNDTFGVSHSVRSMARQLIDNSPDYVLLRTGEDESKKLYPPNGLCVDVAVEWKKIEASSQKVVESHVTYHRLYVDFSWDAVLTYNWSVKDCVNNLVGRRNGSDDIRPYTALWSFSFNYSVGVLAYEFVTPDGRPVDTKKLMRDAMLAKLVKRG